MTRIFISDLPDDGSRITVTGENAFHLNRSLRMRVGDTLTVCDGRGTDRLCTVEGFTSDTVSVRVEGCMPCPAEPPYQVTVYQALAKGDKMDTVVQKAVEAGACRIVPFQSSRCIQKEDREKADKYRQRRQRIALDAAGQCGRGVIPVVSPTLSFREALRDAAAGSLAFLCYEEEKALPLGTLIRTFREKMPDAMPDIRFMVGPEGGFAPEEAAEAAAAGLCSVGLGPRILRTETAALFVLSCLSYEWELGRYRTIHG